MERKNKVLLTAAVYALLIFLAQPAYANGGRGRGGGGDYYHRGGRRSYYRYHHYYPKDYYYRKSIYYYPRKRYYYYYDVYPEKRYYYNWEKPTNVANPSYLPITSIVNMASQGVPDSVIISEIEQTQSKYKLDTDTISYLRQNGVSDEVIDYMLASANRP